MSHARGDPPVVSRSTAQKVTSCSGVDGSSKLRRTGPTIAEHAFGRGRPRRREVAGGIPAGRAEVGRLGDVADRYRCTACGNLTRFDVVTTRRTRAFHHYTVGGELTIEDEEVLDERVDEVVCRWCGHGAAVERLGDGAGAPVPDPSRAS